MPELDTLIGLIAGAVILVRLADLVEIPYPIVLVLAGIAVSAIPGVHEIGLTPEIIFLIFLPPLLFSPAQRTSPRDLRADLKPLTGLVVGLSIVTMLAVAVVARNIVPELGWTEALLLGAIVAPTDPVAAIATFSRIGVPERVVRLVESESLVNDATALVIYRVLLAGVVSGSLSAGSALLDLVIGVAGGVAIGLAVGWLTAFLQRRLVDSALSILITVSAAYGSFAVAEHVGASGVLSTVAAGVYVGLRARQTLDADTRLNGKAFWETVVFTLNVILFVLLGFKLPAILDAVTSRYSAGELALWGVSVSLAVITVRLAWQFIPPLVGKVFAPAREFNTGDDWRERLAVGWSGMRGAVSLAAALALPLTLDSGESFDDRYVLAFITVAVIFSTLVIQGLTLPSLLRFTGLNDPVEASPEEADARIAISRAALEEIDRIVSDNADIPEELVERYRTLYKSRLERWESLRARDEHDDTELQLLERLPELRQRMIDAERRELQDRRRRLEMPMTVYHQLERELDLEESRLTNIPPPG